MPDNQESHGLRLVDVLSLTGALISIILAVLGIVLVKEAREGLDNAAHSYGHLLIRWTFVIVGALWSILLFYRTRRLSGMQRELDLLKKEDADLQANHRSEVERLQSNATMLDINMRTAQSELSALEVKVKAEREAEAKRTSKEEDRRWENFDKIEFGHIRHSPFLKYATDQSAEGLGVKLLQELLSDRGIPIHQYGEEGEWDTILEGLMEEKYDVVATPLFATFERSKKVRFTSPLFFSNIGFYVNHELYKRSGKDFWKNLAVKDIKSKISMAGKQANYSRDLELLCIKEEISSNLAYKYAEKGAIREDAKKTQLKGLFEDVEREPTSALFCESFFAHLQPSVKAGNVINVLSPHQILYPVCIAVRFGDDHLANLLNIRLLEYTRKGGALDLLAADLAIDGKVSQNIVKEHFVAEWPILAENS